MKTQTKTMVPQKAPSLTPTKTSERIGTTTTTGKQKTDNMGKGEERESHTEETSH